jgi:hypothetical protein
MKLMFEAYEGVYQFGLGRRLSTRNNDNPLRFFLILEWILTLIGSQEVENPASLSEASWKYAGQIRKARQGRQPTDHPCSTV